MMNDNELIEYIKKVPTNFKSHVENGSVEMSLEYYNLCEELMARGINAIQENQQLKENLKEQEQEYNRMFGLWNNRKYIKKFNKEYDEEDKKNNPNRNYASVYPDAEEIYKRYYCLKEKLELVEKANKDAIEYISKFIPIDTDTILMIEKQRDYLIEILDTDKGE